LNTGLVWYADLHSTLKQDWLRPVSRTAHKGYILLTVVKNCKICQKGKVKKKFELVSKNLG
jgi:hypothetical protein